MGGMIKIGDICFGYKYDIMTKQPLLRLPYLFTQQKHGNISQLEGFTALWDKLSYGTLSSNSMTTGFDAITSRTKV